MTASIRVGIVGRRFLDVENPGKKTFEKSFANECKLSISLASIFFPGERKVTSLLWKFGVLDLLS